MAVCTSKGEREACKPAVSLDEIDRRLRSHASLLRHMKLEEAELLGYRFKPDMSLLLLMHKDGHEAPAEEIFLKMRIGAKDLEKFQSEEFEKYGVLYYPGCGFDITPLFGKSSRLIYQDRGGDYFDDVPVHEYWRRLMKLLEDVGLVSNASFEAVSKTESCFKFKANGVEKQMVLFTTDVQHVPPCAKDADYVLGRGLAVRPQVISHLKVGCVIDASSYTFGEEYYWYIPYRVDGYSGGGPDIVVDLEGLGIRQASSFTTWVKERQVSSEKIKAVCAKAWTDAGKNAEFIKQFIEGF